MTSATGLALVAAAALAATACVPSSESAASTEKRVLADKAFVHGGAISMQLEGGNYEIRAAADNQIRVTVSGNVGDVAAEVTVDGTRADVVVKNTPHNNFTATIEVPTSADLTIRLGGGNLVVSPITGNKDVESVAGNVEIGVANASDYKSVDATVKAGNIEAGPFGESKSGLFQHYTWSGPGQHTLRASLGAGNLELKGK